MGNYGEDTEPNIGQMGEIARAKNLGANLFTRSDQWSINSAQRVISLQDGGQQFQCKVKFNPKTLLD